MGDPVVLAGGPGQEQVASRSNRDVVPVLIPDLSASPHNIKIRMFKPQKENG